ncbi:MAG: adenylyl-sulfate kinase [Deltaproteobacteria bacterium]|nr:adenylyl-sulfate kinase [Deltaproteobacteria bacterium]
MVIWLVGLSGAGKTTIGREVYARWKAKAPNTVFIDGDEIRGIFRHEGEGAYTIAGRRVNSERISALCRWLDRQGINVVCSMLSIFEDHRAENRKSFSRYFEVYLDVSLEDLFARDSKGLYRDAREGRRPNVVGIDIPFSAPASPDLVLSNGNPPLDILQAATEILQRSGVLP